MGVAEDEKEEDCEGERGESEGLKGRAGEEEVAVGSGEKTATYEVARESRTRGSRCTKSPNNTRRKSVIVWRLHWR